MAFFPVRKYLESDEECGYLNCDSPQYVTNWAAIKDTMHKELNSVLPKTSITKLWMKLRDTPLKIGN